MDPWLKMGRKRTKQDQLHNNKTDGATSISGIKEKLQK
jgi:hypothetical protein